MSTPPWLCSFLLGGLSFLYQMENSHDDISESSQVSVPIIISGFTVSLISRRSGFLFFIDWKFMFKIFKGFLFVFEVYLLRVVSCAGGLLFIGDYDAVGAPGLPMQPKRVCWLLRLSNMLDVSMDVELKKLVEKFGILHWMQCQLRLLLFMMLYKWFGIPWQSV